MELPGPSAWAELASRFFEEAVLYNKKSDRACVEGQTGWLRLGGGLWNRVVWFPDEGKPRCVEDFISPFQGLEKFKAYLNTYLTQDAAGKHPSMDRHSLVQPR